MNMAMIAPVTTVAMNPNNYLGRKGEYKKPVRAKKKEEKQSIFSLDAVDYRPTDPDEALREFYSVYGR